MLVKTQLPCCAMCFLSNTDNNTTRQEIEIFIEKLKKDAFHHKWQTNDRSSGERTILTVVSPHEIRLASVLEISGFRLLSDEFNRRFGYPEGKLRLYVYHF